MFNEQATHTTTTTTTAGFWKATLGESGASPAQSCVISFFFLVLSLSLPRRREREISLWYESGSWM